MRTVRDNICLQDWLQNKRDWQLCEAGRDISNCNVRGVRGRAWQGVTLISMSPQLCQLCTWTTQLRFPPPGHHINITESWPQTLQSIRGVLRGNYYIVIIDQHLHKDSQIEQQVTFQSVSLFHIAGTGLLTKWVLAWLYNPLEVTRWRQIISTISPKPLRGRSSWD